MTEYTARMRHNEATITKLVETQYNTFQYGKKLVRIVLAVVMIGIGLYMDSRYVTPMICLIFGCILISGLNVRTRYNAKKICAQMNGDYPSSDYSFVGEGFKFYEDGEIIPYQKLIRLVEDRGYLYLYISRESAYMVDRSTVSGGDCAGLMSFLAAKTGLTWTKPFTLMSFRFRSVIDLIKNRRSAP